MFVDEEAAEWLTARTGCEFDFDRLDYLLTLRAGPSADDGGVTGVRPEALPAFRGALEAFDKVSEHLVITQDAGLWSIDEVRRIFLHGRDLPIYDGTFDVSPQQTEPIVAKAGCEFDFDRFGYQFGVRPET